MLRPLSVQLYSLRDYAKDDFVAVLKKVAEIGYKGVEPAGFWNLRPSELKKIVEDLGMKIYSSHSPWARGNNLGECMELADALGLKTIVCGYGPDDFKDLDSIKKTAELTNKMQEFFAATDSRFSSTTTTGNSSASTENSNMRFSRNSARM